MAGQKSRLSMILKPKEATLSWVVSELLVENGFLKLLLVLQPKKLFGNAQIDIALFVEVLES